MASIRLIEVHSHVVLSGKPPPPSAGPCGQRGPYPLGQVPPFTATWCPQLSREGGTSESSARPLVCPQHLRPLRPPPEPGQVGPSKHLVDLGEGFLTLTMPAAPARSVPLVEPGLRISSLTLCCFPEEKTKAQSGAVICPGYSGQVSPGGASGKEPTCQCRRYKRHRFDPWVGTIPWRRAWQLMPVFLPGESPGQRSLAGYSPQHHKETRLKQLSTCMYTVARSASGALPSLQPSPCLLSTPHPNDLGP